MVNSTKNAVVEYTQLLGSLGGQYADTEFGLSKLSLEELNHIEVETKDGDVVADSGYGTGWQGEMGLTIPVARKWRLIPGIRYRSLSRDISIGTTTTQADLRYISIGMGVSWTF